MKIEAVTIDQVQILKHGKNTDRLIPG